MASHGSAGKGEERIDSVWQDRLNELRTIERDHGGIIQPEDVVAFARNPRTALHSAFEWDDGKAAEKYRLEQARKLMRVIVEVIPNTKETIRAFVSLRSERYDEGGYRYMPDLLRTDGGRSAVLDTALWELKAFQEKYRHLNELAAVFAAIRKVSRKVTP